MFFELLFSSRIYTKGQITRQEKQQQPAWQDDPIHVARSPKAYRLTQMSAIWISGEWPILAVGVVVGAEGGGGDSVELHFLHDGFRCGLSVSWAASLKS